MTKLTTRGLVAGLAVAALAMIPGAAVAQDDTGTALVRILHASPDAPAVDVYADGTAVLTEVPFGVISDYLEVPAGDHEIAVVATGADLADGAVIGPVSLTFDADTATTVAATNALASIEAQVLLDQPVPNAEGAQVR